MAPDGCPEERQMWQQSDANERCRVSLAAAYQIDKTPTIEAMAHQYQNTEACEGVVNDSLDRMLWTDPCK